MSTHQRIRFRLTDYTPLSAFSRQIPSLPEDFLETFLHSLKPDTMVVNHQKSNRRYSPKLLEYFEEKLLVSGIVGVVRNPCFSYGGSTYDVTAEIRSRFDEDTKPWFLCTMLQQHEDLQSSGVSVPEDADSFFDMLLAFRFHAQLRKALQKGWFRTYVRREANDSRMRGAFDAARHIRRNAGLNNGRIACTYRERTEENALNRLILCAWEALFLRYPAMMETALAGDSRLQQAIRELQQTFAGETRRPRSCIAENLKPLHHPYYVEYEALRETCLMILRDESINFFSGTGEEVQSVLFYLPDLWEIYLERLLRQILPEGDTLLTQEGKLYLQGKTARPDFLLERGGRAVLVADAKCKKKFAGEDYDKLIRDMVVWGASQGALLRPKYAAGSVKSSVLSLDSSNPYAAMRIIEGVMPVPSKEGLTLELWQKALETGVKQMLAELYRLVVQET